MVINIAKNLISKKINKKFITDLIQNVKNYTLTIKIFTVNMAQKITIAIIKQ